MRSVAAAELGSRYCRWTAMRAALHRGWWLAASLYMVVDAGLTPAQIVAIGAAQSLLALLAEIPAGVLADTVGRRWSLVASHVLMGTAMSLTGLVVSFPALMATQMLWGLAWCFASGADVAWITDELTRSDLITSVLTRAARAELAGTAAGLVLVGGVAWGTSLRTAIVAAGAAMLALGGYVLTRFPERAFVSTQADRWRASWRILGDGLRLVRNSRAILVMFVATMLMEGAGSSGGRLQPKALVDLGLPTQPDPIVWLTGLTMLSVAVGVLVLRIAEGRIDGRQARWSYTAAAVLGAAAALLLAAAPDPATAAAAILLLNGITAPMTRLISTLWVNARTTSSVRATVHSLLAQAEYTGEIVWGLLVALIAHTSSLAGAMIACAVLYALTALVVGRRDRAERPGSTRARTREP